jgi:hypothetical protein
MTAIIRIGVLVDARLVGKWIVKTGQTDDQGRGPIGPSQLASHRPTALVIGKCGRDPMEVLRRVFAERGAESVGATSNCGRILPTILLHN